MFRCVVITLSSIVFLGFWAGVTLGECPPADLDGDCLVGLSDLRILAEQWLTPPEKSADLNLDDSVDGEDFSLLANDWLDRGVPVAINEWMASNNHSGSDPQGDFDDWIELYNYGPDAIDVGGMYITDNFDAPTKWQIPENDPGLTTIAAGGYLLIWADDDAGDAGLHTSFKLDADGDEVGLYDVDGITLVDGVEFSDQESDISTGRYPDGSDNMQEMVISSPGGANVSSYYGVVERVKFSHKRGFYDAPFYMTIATETEGATIRYTTDGSTPSETHGETYSNHIRISKSTVLRAMAFKSGWLSSQSEGRSYIFIEDVKTQSPYGEAPGSGWPTGSYNGQVLNYGMDPDIVNSSQYRDLIDDALLAVPTVSIVTDLKNLFDRNVGIYVNARQDGRAWERPASVELINPDGSDGFQINAGLRIRGGYSRSGSNPKHAFRLFFREEYGEGKLKYPLFGDEGVDEFDKVDLRCSQNYSWAFSGNSRNTMVREVFSRDLQGEMGSPYTKSRYYHLYINGHYWGLYMTQERSEARFAESYMGGDKLDYDVVKVDTNSGRTIIATDGNLDAYYRLYVAARRGFDDETYNHVQGFGLDGEANASYEKLLDVDNLIDFMIVEYYTGDRDGPGSRYGNIPNNMYGIYNRANPDGWKWFQHDSEHSLGTGETNLVSPLTSAGANWEYFNPHWLHEQLTEFEEYRYRFGDRVRKHLFNGGLLTPEVAAGRISKRASQIDLAVIAESARWGDAHHTRANNPRTRSDWVNAVSSVTSWIYSRKNTLLNQLKGQDWYPATDAPSLSKNGGEVTKGFGLTIGAPRGGVYYTADGSDPRQPTNVYAVIETLVGETAGKRVLMPMETISEDWKGGQPFDDSEWLSHSGSPGGVGYDVLPESPTNYVDLIGLDMSSLMYGDRSNPTANTTCYIRIPFTSEADLEEVNFLSLNIRYDDGFVAYLNGVEIARDNVPATPYYRARAEDDRPDADAISLKKFDVTAHIGELRAGENMLSIHGVNWAAHNSDFLISVELITGQKASVGVGISESAISYVHPVTLNHSTQIKTRALNGETWSALSEATFAVGPVAESLRITEMMYHPFAEGGDNDSNEEYIELRNVGGSTINLNLVSFVDGIDFTFGAIDLVPGQHVLVVEDRDAFEAAYGSGLNIAGEYSGRLSDGGERIRVVDAIGRTIHDFEYKDGWRDITDGEGFSLTIIDPFGTDASGWGHKDSWRASAYSGGSPGSDDSGVVPNPGAIVVSEVLAHSHDEASDWIELYNTTGSEIDMGGWLLSDSQVDLVKYIIPAGVKIGPYGYRMFYEVTNFGKSSVDPGSQEPFALSENGECVVLRSAVGGVPSGYCEIEDFGASETNVSFGRYYKASTDSYNFVAMNGQTPMQPNSAPRVGPVVISEIMYNPDWPVNGSHTNDHYEFVELRNVSGAEVVLYDYEESEPWKFTGGIEFTFPDRPDEVRIPAGGAVLIVRSPSAFSWRYASVPVRKIVGTYEGRLSDGGEALELSKPGDVDKYGVRQYIRVDRVVYSDGSHPADCPGGVDLWPVEADGGGSSLQRAVVGAYGNDPDNWNALLPTPGL